MVTDGECLNGTLDNLRLGYSSKPLDEASIAKARADALGLLEEVLRTYNEDVASGEVGAGGTSRADAVPPIAGRGPTGLLYGRVQSGKTVAMIAFAAAALDNGFRVIVVLTSDYVKLVEQTAKRFGALAGPLVKDSTRIDSWNRDATHIREQIAEHGLVVVCAKNQSHLGTLVQFLQGVGGRGFPALILDDEADQATLDTTIAARAAQTAAAPSQASAIHRRTVANDAPGELGESVRERLPHHVFVQVTATPYALLLQNSTSPLRPSFARILQPADGYTGGEAFFDARHLDDGGKPPIVVVDEHESLALQSGATEAPKGLQQALAFFLVSAAAQFIREPQARALGQNFLCHTSQRTSDHERLADLIRDYLGRIGEELKHGEPSGEVGVRLGWAYHELETTLPSTPPYGDILKAIRRRLPRREIPIVNSANSPADFGREMNFIVGGNILGRGLTIENLLVTYYLRRAKGISQMDTVLQHARMFGYRAGLMPYTRVFLPEDLAYRFHGIHVSEKRLRELLTTTDPQARIPVETVRGLRATRRNVLDTGSLSAYGPGEQLYPFAPSLEASAIAKNEQIASDLKTALGGSLVPNKFIGVPMAQLVALMKLIPFPESDAGGWDPDTLGEILLRIADRYGGEGAVYYRSMERAKARLSTGAASGDEIKLAKQTGRPVLFLFKDTGKHLGTPFWYPTLLLPEDMNVQVFNVG